MKNRSTRRRNFQRDKWLLLAVVPGLTLMLTFHYLPLLGNIIAFKDYQPFIGIVDSPWVGFSNFSIIFNGDHDFVNALVNTLIITFLQVTIVFPIPIALALLLDSLMSERIKKIVQSVMYLPHFLSWVIVVAIFAQMLGDAGLINSILRQYDLGTASIIGNSDVFKALLTSQVLWKDAGWATILFLAACPGSTSRSTSRPPWTVPDGGQMWHVTLPGLRSVIVLLLILRLGDALNVGFEQIILQQPAVGTEVSEVLDTYVYNHGILDAAFSSSAAVGLVKGLIGLALGAGREQGGATGRRAGLYKS